MLIRPWEVPKPARKRRAEKRKRTEENERKVETETRRNEEWIGKEEMKQVETGTTQRGKTLDQREKRKRTGRRLSGRS